ncbi:MAG: hypothetical protein IK140_03850 [Clostridia bacterium]|nr:hypothetical protein [Clostridia bacterium]
MRFHFISSVLVLDTFEPNSFQDVNLSPACATGSQFFLKCLRAFPGEKTARMEKSLSGGKLPFVIFPPRAGKAGPAD